MRTAAKPRASKRAANHAPRPAFRKAKKGERARATADKEAEIEIGVRLKHARLVKGLRLRELADTVECSESFLSKVENDKVRPSLAMLHKITGALGINIAQLFSTMLTEDNPVQIVHADNRPMIRTGSFGRGPGILLERLIAASSLLEANVHVVEPGGHTDGVYSHEGEEIGYVLQGQFELQVQGKWYSCKEGDSFFFRSSLPHGYRNRGTVLTKILWVNTPTTF